MKGKLEEYRLQKESVVVTCESIFKVVEGGYATGAT